MKRETGWCFIQSGRDGTPAVAQDTPDLPQGRGAIGKELQSLLTQHEIEGVIRPSVSGTVTIRFASEVASSAITAKAGSTLTWW